MSRATALTKARRLKEIVQGKYGVRTSIELMTGRTGSWDNNAFIGDLGHHVVSRRSQGSTPFLWLVKQGRSDVPGPLSNGYLGFDEVFRIITFDYANHPGIGGPMTLPGGRIPENNGRPYLFGVEVEGGITLDDWPASFREVQARMFAGILEFLGRDERSHAEHGTWTRRKVDRIYYYNHLSEARREIAVALGRGDVSGGVSMFSRHGDQGAEVLLLQLELDELGFDPGPKDGIFGDGTQAALRRFFRSQGKDWNGKVYNPRGYRRLQRALAVERSKSKRHEQRNDNQHERLKALEDIHVEGGVHPVVVSGEASQ